MRSWLLLTIPLILATDVCTRGDSARAPGSASIRVTDDTGYEVRLDEPARRIVSLVPAATEILFALGGGDRVVGRTRFDEHPPEVRSVASVGDGIRPDPERLLERRPDLVVIFAGPDNRASIQRLRELDITALAIRHNDLTDLRRNIERLGAVTGADAAADSLIRTLEVRLSAVVARTSLRQPVRVYYHLGGDPSYTVGAGSYLDSLLTISGAENVFGDLEAPSPRIGLEAIVDRAPDCILLGTGPESDAARESLRSRAGWSAVSAVRREHMSVVDADLVHRLGPRVGEAAESLSAAVRRCRTAPADGP